MTGRRDKLNPVEKVQIEQSDFITFHVYDWPEVFERRIKQLQPYGRPIICHRIPGARRGFHVRHLAAHRREVQRRHDQLGLRATAKRRRDFPWDSWQKPYTGNGPTVWHHDVFHADGKPYRQAEIDQLRALTGAAQKVVRQGAQAKK